MATYNSMATPAGSDALGLNVNAAGTSLGMEAFDSDLGFDESLLDSVQAISNLPFTPTYDFESFSNTFEDPFSYPSRPNFGGVSEAAVAAAVVAGGGHSHGHGHGHSHSHSHSRSHHHSADADAGFADPETSPQDEELDNKLLSFSAPVAKATLLVDDGGGPVGQGGGQQYVAEVGMTAELYGMFFVAEDVFANGTDGNTPAVRPLELTCYRRNLWQCSGQITLPRNAVQVVTDQGVQAPILELAASITATESIEGKPTEIISIPWKSSNLNIGAGNEDHHKVAAAPPNVPLDLSGGQELDGNRVSLPVSWKRLQFKHATANNGRRKGLQQHYVVKISLLARTKPAASNGGEVGGNGIAGGRTGSISSPSTPNDFVKIAEIQSGPVIVRGRSPRNFDSKKDVPVTGDKKSGRSLSTDTAASVSGPSGTPLKPEKGELAQNVQRYQSLGNIQTGSVQQQQTGDWAASSQSYNTTITANNNQQPPTKKLALSPSLNRPPVPAWSSSDSVKQQPPTPTKAAPAPLQRTGSASAAVPVVAGPTLPINLSLSEDERSPPNRSNSESLSSPQFGGRPGPGGTQKGQGGQNPSGSPLESADLLYEYFPLSLDDWMPPVDAIYRPHVVHHTVVPPEVKAQQVRTKAKRYFTSD